MTPAPAATSLTPDELAQAMQLIEQTRDYLLGSICLLTPAQWSARPVPDRWSIAQIVEHVLAVQGRVVGMLGEHLAAAAAPPAGQDAAVVDALILGGFPNRLRKFSAPPAVHPSGEIDRADAEERFLANCAALADVLISVPGLRDHALEAAPLKAISNGAYTFMDGYQWVLAAALHTERHTMQILEVIAASR